MPVTLPLRLASSVPLFGRLVPSFARPEPLFDERDSLVGLPVRIARNAFDIGLSVAVWAIFTIGGRLSSKPRAEMAH